MSTFNVRDEKAEKILKEIGGVLKDQMPEGYGFSLLIFPFGEGGGMFYISSAERADMIKAMEEFIENSKKDL